MALFFTIVLSAAIVTMFGITYVSGHSPYVVDYENELIDKYENWQKELEKGKKQEKRGKKHWMKGRMQQSGQNKDTGGR